uniref:Secreted protein n=1 Tax=Globodera pallida TaxID=36090 RepID=A0A183BZP5_GLOPA
MKRFLIALFLISTIYTSFARSSISSFRTSDVNINDNEIGRNGSDNINNVTSNSTYALFDDALPPLLSNLDLEIVCSDLKIRQS